MKKVVYLGLSVVLVVVISITFLMFNFNYQKAEKKLAIDVYNQTLNEFNLLLNEEKKFLRSFSKSLVTNKITIKAYKENKPQLISNAFLSFYDNFTKNNLIEEMHFFKYPVVNFVNFEKDGVKINNKNLIAARQDILFTTTSKVGTYFFVCRHFVGLRSISLIKDNKDILGSVSVGTNILTFKDMLDKLDSTTSIYLNENFLKKLKDSYYKFYKKYSLYQHYRVVGDMFKVDLENKFEIKNEKLFVIIPISDIFENKIAYIVIKKDLSKPLNLLKHHLIHTLIFEVIVALLMFFILIFIFNRMDLHYNSLKEIVSILKSRKFNELHELKEIDREAILKNELIRILKEIGKEIQFLKEEVKIYKRKAYRDNITQLYNLNFLEDNAVHLEKHKSLKFVWISLKEIDPNHLIVKEISSKLKEILRKDDVFIRYSEKEFLILLPHTSKKDAEIVKEKISKTIKNLKVYSYNEILKIDFEAFVGELEEDESIFEAVKRIKENR